jgi:PAS domain S-box-containing protein
MNSKQNSAIKDTTSFFHFLFKNSKISALFILDKKGIILDINEGVRNSYGYSREDLIGKNFSLLFTSEDRDKKKPETELDTVLKEGSASDFNFIVHKDGSPIWTNGESVLVKDDQGEVFLVKMVTQVNQEKMLKDFLYTSEEKESDLSKIFDTFLHGIVVFKSIRNEMNQIIDFKYSLINKSAEVFMKRTRNEIIGKRLLEVYPDVKNMDLFKNYIEVVETGATKKWEYFFDKHGFDNWFKASYIKFGDGLITTFDDITERKRNVLNLEKTTAFLLDSQKIAQVGSFEWDMVNDIITGSPEFYRLYGYDETSHTIKDFLDKVIPEDKEKVKEAIENVISNKEGFDIIYRITLSDGSERWLWDRAKVIKEKHGKNERLIGTVADVTESKKAEANLKEAKSKLKVINAELENRVEERTLALTGANEELNKINQELDKYAFIISHDLKSPLHTIEGIISILKEDYKDKPLDKEGLDFYDMINSKIQDMKQLIDEVLQSAKLEKKIKEPINLYHLTQEVIDNLTPPAHFHIFIQHTLPTVTYHRTSLIQILQNLIGNAIKYMNNKRPLIKVAALDHNRFYQICISDNGPGIPKDKLKKIFEIFEVAHSNDGIESHGIGLSIVKQLVEEQGGRVWVESEKGKETHFYFTIPKN